MHPLFMFGFERSGTTLLSMMMGAHPEVAVPFSVTGLWYRFESRLAEYENLRSPSQVERLVDDLLGEHRIKLWDAEIDRQDVLRDLGSMSYADVVRRFHECYAVAKRKPFWASMDIATLYDMDRANAWFPGARFLHIVRDGRDVALSHKGYVYGASNVLECAENWDRDVRANLKMGAMLDADRYLRIRYEDLILTSEATLKRICEFAGVPYSDAMLDYPGSVSERIPEDRRFLWPDISKGPQAGNVYRWRTRMSATDKEIFEQTAGGLLKMFDYDLSPPKRKSPAYYIKEFWYLLGRGHRFDRILKNFGRGRLAKQ